MNIQSCKNVNLCAVSQNMIHEFVLYKPEREREREREERERERESYNRLMPVKCPVNVW